MRDGALASIDEQIAHQQAIIAGKEEEYLLQKQINDLVAAGGGTISREEAASKVTQLDGLKKQAEQTKQLESEMSSLASGIAGEFTSAFKSIIDGTKDVNEAFADMLQGIANQFLDMAMKILQDASDAAADAAVQQACSALALMDVGGARWWRFWTYSAY